MKIKGLPLFQRIALKSFLSKCNVDGDCELLFEDFISLRRLNSLWYGGGVVNVEYKGYTFSIEAIGDVYADLYAVHEDRHLCYVKDKDNNGNFGSEMLSYFRSDKTLEAALEAESCKYLIDLHHGNWWECFVTDPRGAFHDLMWATDSDNLFYAIAEVLDNLDGTINDLEDIA